MKILFKNKKLNVITCQIKNESEDTKLALITGVYTSPISHMQTVASAYVFLNNKNKPISQGFDYASEFKNGVAVVSLYGYMGIINNKGKFILPLKYKRIATSQDHANIIDKKDLDFTNTMQDRVKHKAQISTNIYVPESGNILVKNNNNWTNINISKHIKTQTQLEIKK